ncbi:sodium:solute symporter family protein [Thermococcus aggregans]|uniref:Sodium:solute symporter family protein n=1 Tax=Thermococcus aggregans TaxID=110163 RepID=A0A9E7SN27_THEAG|nr:sodium:solute symporter family protein [Thermococcus aggregans]USS40075.1 sodium:solute symporter family protein [Thermococcus aggregans]
MRVTHIAIILVYLFFVGIATKIAQNRTKKGSDFLIAGGGMGLGVYTALTVGQWIGGITVIGGSQRAYLKGISAGWFGITIAIGIIFAGLIARKIRKHDVITIPGLIGKVFGEDAVKIVNYVLLLSFVIALSLQVVGGGTVLSVLFPEIPPSVMMLITAGIFTVYIYVGGVWAAGIANIIHIVAMYFGLIMGVILELKNVGGFTHLQASLPPYYFSLTGVGKLVILSWFITSATAVIGNQPQLQAIKSAKNDETAFKGCLIAALIVAPAGILAAILGMTARVLAPNMPSLEALPQLIVSTLHPVIGGLLIAGLWAAILSTAAPVLIGTSTLFTKVFYDVDSTSDEKLLLAKARKSVIAVAIISTLLALTINDILNGIVFANNFRIPIALGIIVGLYSSRKRTPKPVIVSTIIAIIIAAACTIASFDSQAPVLILLSSLLVYWILK